MNPSIAAMEVQYIGFPEYDGENDMFFILLEFKHRLFRILLKEDLELPWIPEFPASIPEGYRVEEVGVSGEMDEVLRSTRLVSSGSSAMIRISDDDADYVIKSAYPLPQCRARVAWEYRILVDIERLSVPLPVVRVRGSALEDSQGVFAFRLEKLQEWDDSVDLAWEMRDIARALHKQWICHNDLRQPNLMRRGKDPVLIDFETAGYIGSKVPEYLNMTAKRFSVREDTAALKDLGAFTMIDEVVSRVYGFCWRARSLLNKLSSWGSRSSDIAKLN